MGHDCVKSGASKLKELEVSRNDSKPLLSQGTGTRARGREPMLSAKTEFLIGGIHPPEAKNSMFPGEGKEEKGS